MNRRLRYAVLLAALSLAAYPDQSFAADADRTLTGCLESTADGFALNAGASPVPLAGDADFAKHAGHTVKISGRLDGKTLLVDSLEHVSPQCDPSRMTEANASEGVADPDPKGLTAQDQGGSKADRETTAKIRKALVEDEALSAYAHNIKIITRDGRVTLRGPVRSTQEKAAVAAKAEAVLGDTVDNQLTVEAKAK